MPRKSDAALPLRLAVRLCEGAGYWNTFGFKKYDIPTFRLSDGPHGLRYRERGGGFDMLGVHPAAPATCFPTAVTLAGAWDERLLSEVGRAIGREALARGVGVVLGPGLNLKRSPLGGRNFEYFSEDPLLSGKLAAAFIRGLQSTGAAACPKHFAANSQERERFSSDSVLDERSLRELYLRGFELAVREGRPRAIMCAYNKINGVYCSDSRRLLTDILRGEWGFDGLVVTDWGAMHDRNAAFEAGCDLSMPGGSRYGQRRALRSLRTGALNPQYVLASAGRVARLARELRATLAGGHVCDLSSHHALALRAACEGAVLLKNENGLLPLRPGSRLAAIGRMAVEPRYQGAGSSRINPTRISSAADNLPYSIWAPGCDAEGRTDEAMLSRAEAAARGADCAVVFAGLPESFEGEGFDREHMRLPEGMDALISRVADANPNTCVVLCAGGPVECPWADKVRAILYMGLPGQAGGEAAARLLCGRAEPGGRLAESWPYKYEDTPACENFAKTRDALYKEGLYVGYRYYSTAGVKPRWAFGHGLGYTRWEYSDMCEIPGGVSLRVRNVGERAGSAVVQLYVAPPAAGPHRPALELRGFKKLRLRPGETRRVSFELTRRSFALWQDGWRVQRGEYTVLAGGAADDLPLSLKIAVEGEELPAPEDEGWYAHPFGAPDDASWRAALGREYAPERPGEGGWSMDNTPFEMKDSSLVMRALYHGIRIGAGLSFGRGRESRPEYRMMLASSALAPLRVLQINGGVPEFLLKAALCAANGCGRGAKNAAKRVLRLTAAAGKGIIMTKPARRRS